MHQEIVSITYCLSFNTSSSEMFISSLDLKVISEKIFSVIFKLDTLISISFASCSLNEIHSLTLSKDIDIGSKAKSKSNSSNNVLENSFMLRVGSCILR